MDEIKEIFEPDDFFNHFWNKGIYLKSLASIHAEHSLSLGDVLQLAFSDPGYLQHASMRATYVDSDKTEKQRIIKSMEELHSARNSGETLVFNHFQRVLPPENYWNRILNVLNRLTCCEQSQIALFFTPGNSQGFNRHIDHNDFFTLQLAGSKQWIVYGQDQHFKRGSDADPSKARVITLREGDFLYLPRHTIHEVTSGQEDSLSLSFILKTDTILDLVVRKFVARLYSHEHPEVLYQSFNPYQAGLMLDHASINQIINQTLK